jgi:hypothetical protein
MAWNLRKPNLAVYYREYSEVIGASQGEETNLVRVEWNPDPTGAYHGRPISEKELLEELRAINPAELAAYRLRKKGLQT